MLLFVARFNVESHVVKKNNRPIFRNRLGKSTKLRNAETHMINELIRIRNIDPSWKCLNEYIRAEFKFYFPKDQFFTKKGTINRKLPDLSNLYQLPEDCLTKAGIISDDHYIASHNESSREWTEQSKPYILIRLYNFD